MKLISLPNRTSGVIGAIPDLASRGVYGLKPRFQDLLRPIARQLAAAGITPNQVTITTCIASIAVGIVVAANAQSPAVFLLLPPFLLLRMALNALDGMLAREFERKSDLGLYLNELGDLISDAFCYLPFAFVPAISPLWIGAVIVLALVAEAAGILGPAVHASRRNDGPMGKSDRALAFSLLALWIGFGGPINNNIGAFFSIAMILLLGVTITNRVNHGLAELQEQARTPQAFVPPEPREVEHRYFETHDGSRLFYRYWPACGAVPEGAIVLLHRGHEHGGRLAYLADELNLPAFSVFAWDARGHGQSVVQRNREPALGTFVKDLDCFIAHIAREYGIRVENIAIVSQSIGSVLAAAWVHDFAPPIRCMVLTAPAFKVKLYVPFARQALRWIYRLIGDFHVNSYVRPTVLTHDPERITSYRADPLIRRPISVRVLLGLYGTSDRIVHDAQAIRVPTQLLMSLNDWVVHENPQLEFFDRLGSPIKEKHTFAGFYHDVLGEKDRARALVKVRDFIVRAFMNEPRATREAELVSATQAEFDALCRPLPLLSPKRVGYALTRVAMRTGGRLARGIRIGLATGFDSGSSLDYVYLNQPSGFTYLGKFIDRRYLESTGWSGIRTRKENVIRAIRRSIAELRKHGLPVRILDIAAGHGRYIFEALEQVAPYVESVLLRDNSEENVLLGSRLARERNLGDVVRFALGDAFDRDSLACITPQPTLAVVSGLYELFPDNEPVRTSLAGLADAIMPGGLLVYTGQPLHPQLELIARTLPNREHRPWIMRRRTQAELDQLVADAGFYKVEQWIDDDGIFSVSIARRSA
jgi:alpha-beta hydrolase superfamily lysophospholipase/phosphatidylglycerophosphate synthase/SAM-dependent methyltransferase